MVVANKYRKVGKLLNHDDILHYQTSIHAILSWICPDSGINTVITNWNKVVGIIKSLKQLSWLNGNYFRILVLCKDLKNKVSFFLDNNKEFSDFFLKYFNSRMRRQIIWWQGIKRVYLSKRLSICVLNPCFLLNWHHAHKCIGPLFHS